MRSSHLPLALLALVAAAGVGPVAAEPLTKAQLRCVLALQASGERVARVTIEQQLRCIGGKGPFATCMARDPGRRAGAQQGQDEDDRGPPLHLAAAPRPGRS